jgi:chromosome segregation ATPase
MRYLPLIEASTPRFRTHLLALALALAFLPSIAAAAQQPAVGRQRSPRLTTDDVVIRPSDSKPAAGSEAKKSDATSSQTKPGGGAASAEELSWREQVIKARNRAKEAQRTAEEAELRITALRNDLGRSGQSPQYRNEIVAQLDQAGRELPELRAQAHQASEQLEQLVDYGRQRGFTEAEGPRATSEDGKPNEQYFRDRLSKSAGDIETAERQVQLYDNRVRDISQRIMMNGGKKGGDNFYVFQLQKDRDDAQQKLEEARAALTKAQAELESLKEEARRAGVSADIFR